MKSLQQISALYAEIDSGFDMDRETADAVGDMPAAARIELKQVVNDQAYFVLAWGQLETEIDEACRSAIGKRKLDTNWEMRRGFDFYNPDEKRLSGIAFDRKVAIVLDCAGGPGSPFAKVMSYYELRNRIAHGRLEATRIDVSDIIADFYIIQGQIAR